MHALLQTMTYCKRHIPSNACLHRTGASQEVTFRRLHQAAAVASAGGAAASAGGATAVASTTYLPVPGKHSYC